MDAVVQTHPPAEAVGEEPRDARAVRKLLLSVGLREGQHDPRVVHQLVEVARRYIGDVLVEARAYANHAGRASLEADDVRLAIQAKSALSLAPPRREVELMNFSLVSRNLLICV
jgi:transcription initiation factor TFIID subunit 9B